MPRITAQAKQETRLRILERAHALFVEQGFERATTRDVARAAGIATGTLFNYFATKDAVALTLLEQALAQGLDEWRATRRPVAGLGEALFGLVATLLRALRPHRTYAGDALALALSPFAQAHEQGGALRAEHLAVVCELLREHRPDLDPDAGPGLVSMHLYWTLFVGVLAFWTADPSEHQHDSLAVLDQSLSLFVASLPPADPVAP